jgi:large subunit ribosomal protein L24e
MKRNPRKTRWTKAFRKSAGKEMVIDSTFEFEKRRNIPVRYDRDLMRTTIKAMQRVQEIKSKRERAFYQKRMQNKKTQEKEADRREVQQNINLIVSPLAQEKVLQKQKVQETLMDVE